MKTIVTLLFAICFAGNLFAQPLLKGIVVDENNKKLNNVEINLFEENSLIYTEFVSKKFSYNLSINKYYTIEISKEGYYTKRIIISTKASQFDVEPFECSIELVKIEEGNDEDAFDFPVAIIEYKPYQGGFYFDIIKNSNGKDVLTDNK